MGKHWQKNLAWKITYVEMHVQNMYWQFQVQPDKRSVLPSSNMHISQDLVGN